MAVNPGDSILAAQYNSLQGRVESLLGNGVNDFGYGQPVTSNQTSAGAVVTAARLAAIRNDMANIYQHQTGAAFPLTAIGTGDVIGADQSGTGLTFNGNDYSFDNPDSTKGFNDYLTLMSTLETNRFDIDATQQEVVPSINSDARTTQWSYVTVVSEFDVSFATSNARRHFFNAGGQIRVSGVVTNLDSGSPSYERNLGWQEMIQNPGTFLFGYNYVNVTNTSALNIQFPQTQSFGNYQLTGSYQTIFRKNADSGVYDNSYWTIEAREETSSSIRFRISLVDSGPETGSIQEPVTADITMRYGGRRSIDAVENPFPVYSVVNNFE